MPGIPTKFLVLERVLQNLPPGVGGIDQEFAHLGAIGGQIGDFFLPADPARNPYLAIWQKMAALLGTNDAQRPGLFALYQIMDASLATVDAAAKAQDQNALGAAAPAIDGLTFAANELAAMGPRLDTLVTDVRQLLTGAVPPIEQNPAPPPESSWRIRESLSWRYTGDLLKAFIKKGQALGVEAENAPAGSPERDSFELRAGQWFSYSFGYLVAYVTDTCGAPFVNSIVGGPPRTQWWRTRWINNYVDSWVWGFYNGGAKTISGDTPSIPYTDLGWARLCNAKLHEKLPQPSPAGLEGLMTALVNGDTKITSMVKAPQFSNEWVQLVQDTLGKNHLPPDLDGSSFDLGASFAWMTLALQTGGEPTIGLGDDANTRISLMCSSAFDPQSPGNCSSAPSWANPTIPGDSGGGKGPPPPQWSTQANSKSDSGCSKILAIIGAVLLLTPAWPAGAAAIAVAVANASDGTPVDWAKLRCDIFWYRMYLMNLSRALTQAGAHAALLFPDPRSFGKPAIQAVGAPDPEAAAETVKSRSNSESCPHRIWDGVASWTTYPTNQTEQNAALDYSADGQYPNFFLDSAANPLGTGDILTGPVDLVRTEPGSDQPIQFNNAVDNIVSTLGYLIGEGVLEGNPVPELPNWNLDGDRGQAWATWLFAPGTGPFDDPVNVLRFP